MHVRGDVTYCFGTGRDAFGKVVLHKTKLEADRDVPGPGTYQPLKTIGHGRKSFALKGKLEYGDPGQIALKRAVPGAGTYED